VSSIDYTQERSVVEGKPPLRSLDEIISKPLDTKPDIKFYLALMVTLTMLMIGGIGLAASLYWGTGLWGNNNPVGWGLPIVNFVFWIGIGHAGTLISAILFLFRQKWRTGIARFAEGMTIFAVITAMIFPIMHTGRPWIAAVYLLPYPNQHSLWVNFTSPLLWDVFAVSTYFTVSFVFWYIGLIPDFATLRDRTTNGIKKIIYSITSLGWRHSNKHWQNYELTYLILAGFAMVQNVLIFIRKIFNYEHIITLDTLEKMNKIILLTGMLVGYAYAMEFFIAWYSGVQPEFFAFMNRAFGDYYWAYWIMFSCNVIFPQLFWFKKIRRSIPIMFMLAVLVNVGMWFERFVITVTSLSRDFLPSSWAYFKPTLTDASLLIGSFGLFFTMLLLFTKSLPVISISEVKAVVEGSQPTHEEH